MKIGPKGVLVIAVVAFVAAGAVARAFLMGPWLQERAAARKTERLVSGGRVRSGDIVFQIGRSRQSRVVQEATRSRWSHCGILFERGGAWFVYEAVEPVKSTPLAAWIARGRDNELVVKRLRESVRKLSVTDVARMDSVGRRFAGRPYDALFGWGDERIYCSELVWKIYHRALGVDVGTVQKLSDFDLSTPSVKRELERRYGRNPPLTDSVVSPAAIQGSELLETVVGNP